VGNVNKSDYSFPNTINQILLLLAAPTLYLYFPFNSFKLCIESLRPNNMVGHILGCETSTSLIGMS